MKSYRKELTFNVPMRRGFINITHQVEEALRESGIKEGLCLVNEMLMGRTTHKWPDHLVKIPVKVLRQLNIGNR
jgi:hypothetical protein